MVNFPLPFLLHFSARNYKTADRELKKTSKWKICKRATPQCRSELAQKVFEPKRETKFVSCKGKQSVPILSFLWFTADN